MKAIIRPAVALLLLLFTLTGATAAQQKRQTTPKPQPKPAVAPTPAPTFDTLVPADSYIIYGEVRGAGQLIRSSALNDLLEPVLKLSGPPTEFRALMKWLNAHAEEVMTSRLLLATWPNNHARNLPDGLVAIEFASAEEATKFTVSLNEFLPRLLPPQPPEPSAENSTEKPKPPVPSFYLQRFGSLVVISPKPWTMKQLKPAGSKLLAEDPDFRTAHNRFNSEPVFVYVDTRAISREEEENKKKWEQQRIEAEKAAAEAKLKGEEKKEGDKEEEEEIAAADNFTVTEQVKDASAIAPPEGMKEEPATPDPLSRVLSGLGSLLFESGETTLPEGLAFALSYEGDSFDLRALLVSQAGNKADALPFMPMLITGPAFSPEAPNIFPADTELLATMSLDLPQIYTTMAKPRPNARFVTSKGPAHPNVDETELEYPLAELEKQLKINIKNDLLPLLGPEIAIRLPMQNMNVVGLPGAPPITGEVKEQPATNGPVLAIAIKDREAMKALIPKLIEAFGMKGANALAQTERREDTELVSFGNMFAYAFVGNFLVISSEAATTRYVVDSYLKHETLATDAQFRNSTRWQPRPLQGQLYISPALMEGYKIWAQQPTTRISDQTRAFLVRASSMAQPITYSLSNEGLGPLHEIHIPKNLVLMAVAGISGESNPPKNVQNERMAMSAMYMIAHGEQEYLKKNGSTATLEQLIQAGTVSKEMIENSGYRFELTATGEKFEVSAVPQEYGKSGSLSLFIDQTFVLRAADHNGAAATVSDPPMN